MIFIAAKNNHNTDVIKEKLYTSVASGIVNTNDTVVTNARHHEELSKADEYLLKVLEEHFI